MVIRSRTGRRRRYGFGSGGRTKLGRTGVTNQRDFVVQYRKKSMPKRKRRQWKNFVKKVRAVMTKSIGTHSVCINSNQPVAWTGTGQLAYCFHLYGKNGNNVAGEHGADDLSEVFVKDSTIAGAGRALFKSGTMDMSFHNTGWYETIGGEVVHHQYPLELDIYEVFHSSSPAQLEAMLTELSAASTNTPTISPGTYNALNIGQRGTTPFQLPEFFKYGNKIMKKTKHLIPSGEFATYYIRDPANHIISNQQVQVGTDYVYPKVTKSILVIVKALTGATATTKWGAAIGCTRTYAYGVIEDDSDRDGYIG